MRAILLGAMLLAVSPAAAHDIYTALRSPHGQLCCGGDTRPGSGDGDCAPALVRMRQDGADFLVRGKDWVHLPTERITFLPVPGEETQQLPEAPAGLIYGHFCGVRASEAARKFQPMNVFDGWLVYCAFVPPGTM